MSLKQLTDSALHQETIYKAQNERIGTVELIRCLIEINDRKLFSDFKCSSLHEYCTKLLKLSEGSAQRRIEAAKLVKQIPVIASKLSSGSLTLTVLSLACTYFRQKEIKSPDKKLSVLLLLEGLSKDEAHKKLLQMGLKNKNDGDYSHRVDEKNIRLSLVLNENTVKKFNRVKGFLTPNISNDEFMNIVLDLALESIEKKKFKTTESSTHNNQLASEKETASPPPVEVKDDTVRYIPNAIKREVYKRDKVCVICSSVHNLNFDHIKPLALGGKTEVNNLRLLCFHCNQRQRIKAGLIIPKEVSAKMGMNGTASNKKGASQLGP